MGIDVVVDEAARIVTVRFEGTVTFEDFQHARSVVPTIPGWHAELAHILDFTAATGLDLSTVDIKRLAGATPIFAPEAIQVLVARAGSVDFGLSRMFEAYSEGRRNVHVVSSIDEALAVVRGRV